MIFSSSTFLCQVKPDFFFVMVNLLLSRLTILYILFDYFGAMIEAISSFNCGNMCVLKNDIEKSLIVEKQIYREDDQEDEFLTSILDAINFKFQHLSAFSM